MKNFSVITILLIVISITIGCSSKKNDPTANPPSNLVINATVAQDSSGNVSFTATATNAVSYLFDFGDGNNQTVTSGTVNYKYSKTGVYSVSVTAKSSAGLTALASTQITVALPVKLLWSDEFNVDGAPDATKWGYDLGDGGWGNNELEYYTSRADNAFVKGGYLNIVLKKESYNGSSYTSARMLTKNKFSFYYGHVDIKAMLPAGFGTWPALWMLGSDIDTAPWPACGEIDIMEQRGSELNKIYGTLHYPGRSGANGNGSTTTIQNATTQFHVYSLDWSPTFIKISVDGLVYQTVPNNSTLPFNGNFFFIFNIAMGGDFGGSPDPNFTSASMLVDYIRVYQ